MYTGFFYHGHIRSIISAFGALFNNINIVRSDGTTTQTIKVPLMYGPKQRHYYRNQQDPNAGSISDDDDDPKQIPVQMVVPAMSYELTGIQYASNRKGITVQKHIALIDGDNTQVKRAFQPIPVTFTFSLDIITKNFLDSAQIVEQILPWFTPDFTISVKDIPALGISHDIHVILRYPVSPQENWADDFKERQETTWTLMFDVEGWMYGPVLNQKLILHAITRATSEEPSDNPIVYDQVNVSVDPSSAMPDDEFGFLVTLG